MSSVEWNCGLFAWSKANQVLERPPENLSVGDPFIVQCEGDPVVGPSAEWQLPKEHKYKLKVLSTRFFKETQGQWLVTSYQVGTHVDLPAKLELNGSEINLHGLTFQVKSVIQPQQGQPAPTPYPSQGPLHYSLPPLFWWILAALLLFALLGALFYFTKRLRRRQVLERLRRYKTPLSPEDQFSKDLRQLGRTYFVSRYEVDKEKASEKLRQFVNELDLQLRLFFIRRFQMDFLEKNLDQMSKMLRAYDKKLYEKVRERFLSTFQEISQAKSSSDVLTITDCQQLSDLSRLLVAQVTAVDQQKETP